MSSKRKKIGILGVGNILLSDEGFGVHVVDYLEKTYAFGEGVTLLDGGTAGIYMAPFLEDHDPIFVVDVMTLDGALPGSIHSFSAQDATNSAMKLRMSPHQLGILDILAICELRGRSPEALEFYCVVPESLATGLEMSGVVASQVPRIGNLLVKRLRQLGQYITLLETEDA